jgi:large subunit ribosomal protein L21
MYAVIALGGKQYRVRPGEKLTVDRLPHAEGDSFDVPVLLANDGDSTRIGADELAKVTVSARVVAHTLGKKIHVLTYRSKKDSKRKIGHRSRLSLIEIERIAL